MGLLRRQYVHTALETFQHKCESRDLVGVNGVSRGGNFNPLPPLATCTFTSKITGSARVIKYSGDENKMEEIAELLKYEGCTDLKRTIKVEAGQESVKSQVDLGDDN